MLNVNSPIVQSLGAMSNMGIAPNMSMGNNTIGIGNYGYNQQNNMGGYYNNNYYYNPYLAQQQEKLRIAQEREESRKQSDILKMMSRRVSTALGKEIDEEKINKLYDPVYQELYDENAVETPLQVKLINGDKVVEFKNSGSGKVVPMCMESQKTATLMQLHMNWTGVNPHINSAVARINKEYEESKKRFPDDMSLFDFMKQAGALYVDSLIAKDRRTKKDKTMVYSTTDYNTLLNVHSQKNFFPDVFGQMQMRPDIGDMEIRLPDHLKNERQRRKDQFLSAILGGGMK